MDRENAIQFLKKFKEENKRKYHIKNLGIFGSLARDMSSDNSDIEEPGHTVDEHSDIEWAWRVLFGPSLRTCYELAHALEVQKR